VARRETGVGISQASRYVRSKSTKTPSGFPNRPSSTLRLSLSSGRGPNKHPHRSLTYHTHTHHTPHNSLELSPDQTNPSRSRLPSFPPLPPLFKRCLDPSSRRPSPFSTTTTIRHPPILLPLLLRPTTGQGELPPRRTRSLPGRSIGRRQTSCRTSMLTQASTTEGRRLRPGRGRTVRYVVTCKRREEGGVKGRKAIIITSRGASKLLLTLPI
jgi:hypothetical protein